MSASLSPAFARVARARHSAATEKMGQAPALGTGQAARLAIDEGEESRSGAEGLGREEAATRRAGYGGMGAPPRGGAEIRDDAQCPTRSSARISARHGPAQTDDAGGQARAAGRPERRAVIGSEQQDAVHGEGVPDPFEKRAQDFRAGIQDRTKISCISQSNARMHCK
jgi:hypothetical protein